MYISVLAVCVYRALVLPLSLSLSLSISARNRHDRGRASRVHCVYREYTFSCGVVAQVTGTWGWKPCAHFSDLPLFVSNQEEGVTGFFLFFVYFFPLARALWRTGMSHDAARLSWWQGCQTSEWGFLWTVRQRMKGSINNWSSFVCVLRARD